MVENKINIKLMPITKKLQAVVVTLAYYMEFTTFLCVYDENVI